MNNKEELELAGLIVPGGQWALQLFGDELEKSKGDFATALENAKKRFAAEPSPPQSETLRALNLVDTVKYHEEHNIPLPEEEDFAPKEEEQLEEDKEAFGPKPKHPKVKPSPFEKASNTV